MEFRVGERWEMLDDAIPGTDGEFFAKDLSQVGTLNFFCPFIPCFWSLLRQFVKPLVIERLITWAQSQASTGLPYLQVLDFPLSATKGWNWSPDQS